MGLVASPEDLKLFRSAVWKRKQTCFVRFWDQSEEAIGREAEFNIGKSFQKAGAESKVVSFLFPEEDKQKLNGLHAGALRGTVWIGCEQEGVLPSRLRPAGPQRLGGGVEEQSSGGR